MKQGKYPPELAAAVIGASSSVGPIIPPSIAFVIIGCMTGTSIGRLFLGGAIPGFFMGLMLLITNYFTAKRMGLTQERRFSWRELFRSTKAYELP